MTSRVSGMEKKCTGLARCLFYILRAQEGNHRSLEKGDFCVLCYDASIAKKKTFLLIPKVLG